MLHGPQDPSGLWTLECHFPLHTGHPRGNYIQQFKMPAGDVPASAHQVMSAWLRAVRDTTT
jgi:hypothetical protein